MIKLNGHLITPTIFPDKTSQVWRIPEEFFHDNFNTITWEFESEAEFLHIAQLKNLIDVKKDGNVILDLPYLPYARQDKNISNNFTFALRTFANLLNSLEFSVVRVIDPHNIELSKSLIDNLCVVYAQFVDILLQIDGGLVYPDKGAEIRYGRITSPHVVVFDKDRESTTGDIKGVKIFKGVVEPISYLIVDDLCDGGRTFIEVAKKLYEKGAKEVHLYVSHGIFSKGLEPLREAGIRRIFTRKGEVK